MARYFKPNGAFVRDFPVVVSGKSESDRRMEESAKKILENNKFHDWGMSWEIKGNKLSNATEIVTYYGEKMELKEVRPFKNGFWANARGKASKLGETGTPKDMLPLEYTNDGEFMKLYNQGVKKYGFNFGINEVSLEDLPMNFRNENSFTSGYYEGRGFVLGYNGATVLDLPSDLVQNRAFFVGYEMGIEKKAKESKVSKRKR